MGESVVETPFVKNKMGESVKAGPTLEVSVSFGRFDNDALSWEKWSSFSPNKYLEEVEKCATPGSVAQKKAYFEAHYKKIAARKVEQIEQEKQQLEKMDPLPEDVTEPRSRDQFENTQVLDADFRAQQKLMIYLKDCDVVDEPKEDITVDVECDDLSVTKVKEPTIIDESKEHVSVDMDGDSLVVAEAKEETISRIDESKKDVSVDMEDSLWVSKAEEGTVLETCDHGEGNPEKGCQDKLVETPQMDSEAPKSSVKKSKNSNAIVKNAPRKVHTKEDRVSAGTKKKLTSPVMKSSKISTPLSKPASTTKANSPSQPSAKKVNVVPTQSSNNAPLRQSKKVVPGSPFSACQPSNKMLNSPTPTPQRSKNSPVLEKKRVAPSSLHMSLSLGFPNSAASTTTMRKSLIMEKMGDKEIVKRAFRAFQKSFSQGKSAGETTYGGQEQFHHANVLSKGSEQKLSTAPTPQRESERLKKTPDKVIPLKSQPRTRSTSLSSGGLKDAVMEKQKVNSVRASTVLRTDRSTDKWKEEVTKAKIKRPGSNR